MVKPKEIIEEPQEKIDFFGVDHNQPDPQTENKEQDLLNQLEAADNMEDDMDGFGDLEKEFAAMDGGGKKQNPFGQSITKELLAQSRKEIE